jgi:hypothetical protein
VTVSAKRLLAVVLTAAALAAAIATVVTGPPESMTFDLRLPLLVLVAGLILIAAQWGWRPRWGWSPPRDRRRQRARMPLPDQRSQQDQRPRRDRRLRVTLATDLITDPPRPVPMATPWLVLSVATGIAAATLKAYESNPPLVAGVLGGSGVFCLIASVACLYEWLRLPADRAELVGEG